MKKYFSITLSIIILSTVIFAIINILFLKKGANEEGIVSITSYSELEGDLHKASTKSLIVFDVDDVLITAADAFADGTHIPIDLKVKLFFKHPNLLFRKNWEKAYSLLWAKAPRYLVDPNIPNIISSLKEKNIPMIMLTSMESGTYGVIESFPEWRFTMLKDFGVNLVGQFKNKVFTSMPQYRGNYPLLYNGILCANQQSKGKVLEEFIKKNKLNPDQIYFIDDGRHNLSEVKKSCERMNVECRLYHFEGNITKKVNSDIALAQIEHLINDGKWLSDFSLSKDSISPKAYSNYLDDEMHKRVVSNPPYAAMFSTSKNKIIFIAVDHVSDLNSKTFELIKASITNFKPELVIYEGEESSLGYSSKDRVDYIEKNCNNKSNWRCGESLYSAYMQHQTGHKFLGGEPDDATVIKNLLKSNYTLDDVVFFYFTRQIPQLNREGKIKNLKDIQDHFDDFAKSIIKEYEPIYNNYKSWVISYLQSFDFLMLIDSETTAPINTGTYLQKISSDIGVIRDKHLLNIISSESGNFRNILIVYGSSHLSTQYDVLTKMYGPARFFNDASRLNNYILELSHK